MMISTTDTIDQTAVALRKEMTTNDPVPATITIEGREFQVSETGTPGIPYIIKGKRNAEYMLCRYVNTPGMLFALKMGGGRPFKNTDLCDQFGPLRVATYADVKACRKQVQG